MQQGPNGHADQNYDQRQGYPTSTFSRKLTDHLVSWKHSHITTDQGSYQNRKYDTLLPEDHITSIPNVYHEIREEVALRQDIQSGKITTHVADPVIATINLFYPILRDSKPTDLILKTLNTSFDRLATEYLEKGFHFSFTGPFTSVELTIAYYDTNSNLTLWQIKHPLATETLPSCAGYRSYENHHKASCRSTKEAGLRRHCHLRDKSDHDIWGLSNQRGISIHGELGSQCPFLDNNQLWLLTLQESLLKSEQFHSVHTSVVIHPENQTLRESVSDYQARLPPDSITVFTSSDLVDVARDTKHDGMNDWINWYTDHYMIP